MRRGWKVQQALSGRRQLLDGFGDIQRCELAAVSAGVAAVLVEGGQELRGIEDFVASRGRDDRAELAQIASGDIGEFA